MISEKRSQAARANGARSRGPVTPEGKAISSRNAMRHGLLAKTVVLSNEDAPVFQALFDMLIQRFSPVDDVEMSMVEEMAGACWRLRRAMAMENSILESGIGKHPEMSALEETTAAYCDPTHKDDLTRLERYQARLQNTYQRALRGLALLRKIPKSPATPPPEAEPVTEPIALVPNEPKHPTVWPPSEPSPARLYDARIAHPDLVAAKQAAGTRGER